MPPVSRKRDDNQAAQVWPAAEGPHAEFKAVIQVGQMVSVPGLGPVVITLDQAGFQKRIRMQAGGVKSAQFLDVLPQPMSESRCIFM